MHRSRKEVRFRYDNGFGIHFLFKSTGMARPILLFLPYIVDI